MNIPRILDPRARNNSAGRPRAGFPGARRSREPTGPTKQQLEQTGYARDVSNFFTNERNRFVRTLGAGVQGQVIQVNERDDMGLLLRRLAVKFASTKIDDPDLQQEISWLRTLRGCAHIIQFIGAETVPSGPTQNSLRPVLITEFMENGSVMDFSDRVVDDRNDIPNRILWFVFMCRE